MSSDPLNFVINLNIGVKGMISCFENRKQQLKISEMPFVSFLLDVMEKNPNATVWNNSISETKMKVEFPIFIDFPSFTNRKIETFSA